MPAYLFPQVNSIQRASDSAVPNRNKIRLSPGHSPLDWASLQSSGTNLRGIEPQQFPMMVTKELLGKHNSKEDSWTCINRKVYNITPYLNFHPGGVDEIMKCSGRDGTLLFNKYHSWVNYDKMLANCLVGFYVS